MVYSFFKHFRDNFVTKSLVTYLQMNRLNFDKICTEPIWLGLVRKEIVMRIFFDELGISITHLSGKKKKYNAMLQASTV